MAIEVLSRIEIRRRFLERDCSDETRTIHQPILDLAAVDGALNPSGLGNAEAFSGTSGLGQSSLGFETLAGFLRADATGLSQYSGAAEYGVVRSADAAAVCDKMAALHGGAGAILCVSGLAAITTALEAFAPRAIALPDTVYRPLLRYVTWLNGKRDQPAVVPFPYPGNAGADEVERLLASARAADAPIDMVYLEAPGSGTFEIPDIAGIAALSARHGIRSVMDNTWASHARFRPIAQGIDIVIQATTKYEGGYADTPSGVVVAHHEADAVKLAYASRVLGSGAVAPQVCRRLYHRLDSTGERLDRHYDNALKIMDWLRQEPYVAQILCPALPDSPGYSRFLHYFGKGNGLFTVVFREDVRGRQIEAFVDSLNLFRIAQGWGGHVSLVQPVETRRELTPVPRGRMLRFHAGLEDWRDLVRDIAQAAREAGLTQGD